ncbi:hypothetical protein FB451DRAFT_1185207 [Mycena latifolia]|nr:hypothetical protein FB451DRAFT_1185207 [Mycena latifolia]
MTPQPAVTHIRFNNIVACLGTAVTTLDAVSQSFKTPFLAPISNTMRSLLTAVQSIKRNRDDCTQMLEQIHELLYAIIRFHVTSGADAGGELSPKMLDNLGAFTEYLPLILGRTLHKIHTFVEAQQEKSKIKQFFRQGEINALLKDCHRGLQEALDVFKIGAVRLLTDVTEMQQHAQKTHEEVLELISSFSDGGGSDRGSLISRFLWSSHERKVIPRIAILGAGGMGKTSLARAILHHPEISARYDQHRVFVACDAASSSVQLAALVGAHIGLNPGQDLSRPVIHHFTSSPPSLLILDNLETIWEPSETRGDLEQFLSLLTEIEHLALIKLQITMRGAERPFNVQWTHPFLEPLRPLARDAARQTFIDIADNGHALEDIDKILALTDNMPLAIDLMANLVDYEGVSSVLARWETDRTTLLSEGHDKRSNLDLSISLSLASSQITSLPQSRHLLSLLSILPDGLSDVELMQSRLPITNVLACKVALLRTALAYTDDQKRLKALVPIREYMHKTNPPTSDLVQPLVTHFKKLIDIHETYFGTVSNSAMVARIASNFANIQSILVQGLNLNNPDLVTTIDCICQFDSFSGHTGRGQLQLIHQIPDVLPRPSNHRLEVHFVTQLFSGHLIHPIPNAKHLVEQALAHSEYFDDTDLKCQFYVNVAEYYRVHLNDHPGALHFVQTGLALAISRGNTKQEAAVLTKLAWRDFHTGDYFAACTHAYEVQRLANISADMYREAWALRIQSNCWQFLGNYGLSITLATRARHLLSLCGMSGGDLGNAITNCQAEVHRCKSEYVEARDLTKQIMDNVSMEQDKFQYAFVSLNIAQLDVELGAPKHIVQGNIDMANTLLKTGATSVVTTFRDTVEAALLLREGDLLAANRLFEQCLAASWGRDAEVVTYCLERLGDVSQWTATAQTSFTWPVTFLGNSLKLKQKLEIHKALQFLGDVFLAQGDRDTGYSLFTVALDGFTQLDVHRSRGECMLRLGDLSKLQGDMQSAANQWKAARPLFERSSQGMKIVDLDDRLAGIIDSPPNESA